LNALNGALEGVEVLRLSPSIDPSETIEYNWQLGRADRRRLNAPLLHAEIS
jgi:hypothetical protein